MHTCACVSVQTGVHVCECTYMHVCDHVVIVCAQVMCMCILTYARAMRPHSPADVEHEVRECTDLSLNSGSSPACHLPWSGAAAFGLSCTLGRMPWECVWAPHHIPAAGLWVHPRQNVAIAALDLISSQP